MKTKKLLATFVIVSAVIITGCKKDDFNEIVGVCPMVISTNPVKAATGVPLNQVITATFNEKMNPATITQVSYTIQGATPVAGVVSYTGTTASFTPSSPLAPNTTYTGTVKTTVKDLSGNALQSDYVWTFSTDLSPTVISTDPANNATGVVLNKVVTATFSVPMDPLTITAATFTIKQGTTPVMGTVTYIGTTASFAPVTPLAPNTTYTGTITTGAKNVPGTPLANNYVWTFNTGTIPTVISTDPADKATGVVLNKVVTATFSMPMDPLTINTATFTIKQGSTTVPGTISYAGTTASFVPSSALAPNTIYTGTITTGAKNVPGIPLASDYIWTFTTDVPPTVISTDPANNATGVALNKTVTATFSVPMDPSTITTLTFTIKQGTTPVPGIVSYNGTTATFVPSGALAPNTIYTGTITTGAKNVPGTPLANNYVWTFTTLTPTAPTVISTDPANNATGVVLDKTITATFSVPMDPNTINTSTFTIKQGTTPVPGIVSYNGTTATFVPSGALAPNTIYTGTITTGAKNVPGTPLANNYVWTFTTDIPPTVISTDPANNATGVALNKTVTATFSVPMDPSTITTSTFTIKQGTTPVPGNVSYNGTTATFIPSGALAPNTIYTGTITTGARNVPGTPLANNYVWTFTTLTPTAPTILSTDPANDAKCVDLNKTITATFSVPMDPSTINTSTFTIKQGTTPVAGTVTYNGTTASFIPSVALALNTIYTGTITTGVKNVQGTPLANNYVWTFTTGCSTTPIVISTDPANNATGVVLDKTVTATFNVFMDPSTINTSTFTIKQGTTPVAGIVTYSGTTASFNPTGDLLPGTIYTGTITTGAKNVPGTPLANNYVWTFTTIVNAYTLNVTAVNGIVVKNPNQTTYNSGATVQLTATPDPGYTFTSWSGDAPGLLNPMTVTMNSNKNITANFTRITYSLNVTAINGTVVKNPNPDPVTSKYNSGTSVQLTATASPGYTFTNWTGDATGSTNPLTVTMNSDKNITANFTQNTYTLNVTAINGNVVKNPNHATYDSGTMVQLSATPVSGYQFTSWSGDATGSTNPLTVTMNSDKNITANFTAISATYSLNVTAINGTVVKNPNPDPVTLKYNSGATVQLTATPDPGYTFTSWSGDAPGLLNPMTVTMNSDKNITANFTRIAYTLNVTAINGTVVKNPNPDPVTSKYNPGTSVQLTATPSPGYIFTNWTGDAAGSTNPLTVTMNSDKNITANFTQNTYTLNVTAINGTVVKNPNQAIYNSGATVQLTATPNSGYQFTSWSGDATGSTNPLTVTMNSDKNITANFTAISATYALNVTAINGTVVKNPNPDPVTLKYNSGATVQLTATPDPGYTFTSWSGDAPGLLNPMTVTMNSDKNVTANFTRITYSLNVTAINGTVVKNPNPDPVTSKYNPGTSVQLTATANPGYTFTNWTGDATGSTNPMTVTMNADKNITANFTQNTYTLNVTAINGTVVKNPNPDPVTLKYNSGTSVQLTATPSPGYMFTFWTGDATGSTNPLTVTMNSDKNITANFTAIALTYALNVTAINGTVVKNPNPDPITSKYNSGTSVQLTATPNPGYTFTNWTGDATGSNNPLTVTMNADKNITANFALNTYALNVTAINGTVVKNPNPDPVTSKYNSGTSVQLTATPNPGYTFTNWTGDATGSTNPLTVTMNADKNITANFTRITYALNVTAINGTVVKNPNPDPVTSKYNSGTSVQLTATASPGYTFTNWSGDATGSTNPLTVTMNSDKNITANFTQNTYTLNVTAINGTVVKNPNQATYNSGTSVQLTATPSPGYTFTNWTGDATGSLNPLTVTMNSDKNITANFTRITYALNVTAINGTVLKNPLPDPVTSKYNSGTSVQLTATPSPGYIFTFWTGDATGSNNPLTVTMNSDKNITANFTAVSVTYTLNVTAINGTVVKNPDQLTYNSGATVQLTATPNSGYTFTSWSGDATGSINPMNVTMNANKNITANFTLTPPLGPEAIDLGTAGDFATLTKSGISTTGVTSITGDIGVSPIAATGITGFGLIMDINGQSSHTPIVIGKVYASDYAPPTPSKMTTAVSDMETAYTTAMGLTTPAPIVEMGAGNISGLILPPGLYKWGTGVLISGAGVTLSGGPNDVWVFQISQNLTVNSSAIITLSGGAQAKNIFWVVAGQATLGTDVIFNGNILSKTLISLNTGASITGRLLAQTAVTLNASTVVKP